MGFLVKSLCLGVFFDPPRWLRTRRLRSPTTVCEFETGRDRTSQWLAIALPITEGVLRSDSRCFPHSAHSLYGAKFYTPPPPHPWKYPSSGGGGVLKRGGGIKSCRGGLQNIPPPPRWKRYSRQNGGGIWFLPGLYHPPNIVRTETDYWMNSGEGGSSIFSDSLMELIAFRLLPVICPARRAKPENYWKR